MELKIDLDPEALREATGQAIIGILTPEVRERLIQQAITGLLSPSTNSYGQRKGLSPLEEAFNTALQKVAYEIAREEVQKSEEIRQKIRELIPAVALKVLKADPDKLAEKMAESFTDSLTRREY